MSNFRKYEKIHRLGKEETDGILNGTVTVQEKVDGANASVWIEDGVIRCGSRNQDVTEKGFNGLVEYVQSHPGIVRLLTEQPDLRLYGEWLVRHTIQYNETAYRKFYLFDIHTGHEYLPPNDVDYLAKKYGIETVPIICTIDNPALDEINEFVGKSSFGDRGEGVVLKNMEFVNQFGDFCYAKIVTQSFKEDNAITFGGNNKHSDTYWEMYVVNKYVALPRVKKIMEKTQPLVDHRLDMKDIPRITNSVYHDLITEEAWEIVQKVPKLDFKKLKGLVMRKAKQVYVDILNDSISIADGSQG